MLDSAIASIQKAPLSVDGWEKAIVAICHLFESCGGVLFDTGGGNPSVIVSPSLERSTEYYNDNSFYKNDLRIRAIPRLLQSGLAFDQDLISDLERESHPYCRDFLDRFSLRWAAVLGFPVHNGLWALSLQRKAHQDPFSVDQIQTLLLVREHVSNAAALTRVVQTERLNGSLESLDLVQCAALLLDRSGFVLSMNARARELDGSVFRVVGRRPVFIDPADHGGRFSQPHDAHVALQGSSASSRTVCDDRGLLRPMRWVRLTPSARHAFTGAATMILIGPARVAVAEPQVSLSAIYGLTPAEARLALLLASGHSLPEAAEALQVSVATVRDRLKSVFLKTGTSRQSELVRILVLAGIG